jgi:hypothetical protein
MLHSLYKVRKKKMAVNLDRSPAYTNHNIPLEEGNFYRGVDTSGNGWESLFDDGGVMKGYGKGGTENLSFQKDYPNDLYVNGLVKADTIIEANHTLNPDGIRESSGYAYKDQITRDQIESGEVQLRIWERKAQDTMGEAALRSSDVWGIVFDNFPKPEAEISEKT